MANSLSNLFGKLLKRDAEPEAPDAAGADDTNLRKHQRVSTDIEAKIEWFDENGVCRSEPITVRDTSPCGLSFSVNEEFPIDQTLWVETEPNRVSKAVVRHSHPRGRGYLTGAYRVDRERRRTDRFPASGEAILHWGDSQVGPCDTPVRVRNATEYGLQVECAIPLPLGTIVQLIGDELQCDGSTCYCQETDEKFIIGLHLVRQAYHKNALEYGGD